MCPKFSQIDGFSAQKDSRIRLPLPERRQNGSPAILPRLAMRKVRGAGVFDPSLLTFF
jgi:hypothetical protein